MGHAKQQKYFPLNSQFARLQNWTPAVKIAKPPADKKTTGSGRLFFCPNLAFTLFLVTKYILFTLRSSIKLAKAISQKQNITLILIIFIRKNNFWPSIFLSSSQYHALIFFNYISNATEYMDARWTNPLRRPNFVFKGL